MMLTALFAIYLAFVLIRDWEKVSKKVRFFYDWKIVAPIQKRRGMHCTMSGRWVTQEQWDAIWREG